jgi:hypothetical protein
MARADSRTYGACGFEDVRRVRIRGRTARADSRTYGACGFEDLVVVTEDGYENLTVYPNDLRVV